MRAQCLITCCISKEVRREGGCRRPSSTVAAALVTQPADDGYKDRLVYSKLGSPDSCTHMHAWHRVCSSSQKFNVSVAMESPFFNCDDYTTAARFV
jgi:hypothetical protein